MPKDIDVTTIVALSILLLPRRCHCMRQPLVFGCSPHSPVLCPACGPMKCQMQFFAVLSDHVNPSFLLPSPLSGSMYIAVVCYFGVSFILHLIQMSKVSQTLVPYSVYYSESDIPSTVYMDLNQCNNIILYLEFVIDMRSVFSVLTWLERFSKTFNNLKKDNNVINANSLINKTVIIIKL